MLSGGWPAAIPDAISNSRGFDAKCGKARANNIAPTIAPMPPRHTVAGAPICFATCAGEQRADRRHAHEHHRIHGEHAASQVVRRHRLQQRVRRGSLQHHRIAHRDKQNRRKPEPVRERKGDQAAPNAAQEIAIQRPRPRMPVRIASVSAPPRAPKPAAPIKNSECSRAAMQNSVGEDRHQHAIRQCQQTDAAEQQEQRANRLRAAARSGSLRRCVRTATP